MQQARRRHPQVRLSSESPGLRSGQADDVRHVSVRPRVVWFSRKFDEKERERERERSEISTKNTELPEPGLVSTFRPTPSPHLPFLFSLSRPPPPSNPYIPAFSVYGSPALVVGSVQRRSRNHNKCSSRLVLSSLPHPHLATHTSNTALRIRPSNSHDLATIPPRFQRTIVHALSATSVSVDPLSTSSAQNSTPSTAQTVSSKKQQFTFDQVHGPSTTQHAIFTSTASPLISGFLEGFNCTILAYGQTSSGKTHTMTGIDLDADPTHPENGMGIIPRAVATIYSRARELREERAGAWNFSVKGSFIEIYNEDLLDLLADDHSVGGRREVQIREDKHGNIIWDGLREVSVKNTSEVMT